MTNPSTNPENVTLCYPEPVIVNKCYSYLTLRSCNFSFFERTFEAWHPQKGARLRMESKDSDQGSQFTGEAWILALEAHQIAISHDGVGRCIDNIRVERLWWSIKYEHVHLYCHRTMWELEKGLSEYLIFYNTRRRHQGINNMRPVDLYLAA